jgi:hypothetical protein
MSLTIGFGDSAMVEWLFSHISGAAVVVYFIRCICRPSAKLQIARHIRAEGIFGIMALLWIERPVNRDRRKKRPEV